MIKLRPFFRLGGSETYFSCGFFKFIYRFVTLLVEGIRKPRTNQEGIDVRKSQMHKIDLWLVILFLELCIVF